MALGWRKEYLRYRSFFLNVLNFYKKKQDLKMFLEILLSLATITIFGVFALRPTALAITQLLKDIKEKEELVARMDQKIQDLSTAQSAYDAEFARISLVQNAVPEKPLPDSFVRQLEGLAARNNVQILSLSLDEVILHGKDERRRPTLGLEALPDNAKVVVFSASLVGDYPFLYSFITNTENLLRPIKIDALNITTAEAGEEGRVLRMTIAGRTPYLDEIPEKEE